ncbi:hypothetical protein Q604_UNBC02403G0001, partial [human gut metagenome]
VGALAQAWALICLGRGLGALSPFLMPVTPAARLADPTADWRASALQAVLAALVAAVCAGATQLIARSSAASEEGHIRRRVL